jgi:hypothetical protein
MKITRPPTLLTPASTPAEPVTRRDPAICRQTGSPADRRHLANLQAIQTLATQTADIRQVASDSITDQLAVCVAASLTATWLQPPESKGLGESAASTPPDPTQIPNPNLNPNPNPNPPSPSGPVPSPGAEPNPQSAIPNPQSPPSPETDSAALFKRIKKFSFLLARLRRGDHYAEWLQIQRQWHALASVKHQDHLAAQKAKTNPVPRSLRDDGGFTKETIEKTAKALNLF